MNTLLRFFALRASDRTLLLTASVALLRAQISLRIVPFRRIARGIGVRVAEQPCASLSVEQDCVARRVRWGIRIATRNAPWQRAMCLAQSLAAMKLLKRYGIPATLYLGVRQSAGAAPGFDAHAWVWAGTVEVTPRGAESEFVVIACLLQAGLEKNHGAPGNAAGCALER